MRMRVQRVDSGCVRRVAHVAVGGGVHVHMYAAVDGLDPDLSHWYQSGMYIGVGLQGSATQTCVIDSVDIVQTSNT